MLVNRWEWTETGRTIGRPLIVELGAGGGTISELDEAGLYTYPVSSTWTVSPPLPQTPVTTSDCPPSFRIVTSFAPPVGANRIRWTLGVMSA